MRPLLGAVEAGQGFILSEVLKGGICLATIFDPSLFWEVQVTFTGDGFLVGRSRDAPFEAERPPP